jgi:hypothetical protein
MDGLTAALEHQLKKLIPCMEAANRGQSFKGKSLLIIKGCVKL